jgi:coatomer subunit epsilon
MDHDVLFGVRNAFYIGAYNQAINEASELTGLSDAEQTERDVLVYRSYIELGSQDVRHSAGSVASLTTQHAPQLLRTMLRCRVRSWSLARCRTLRPRPCKL